MKVGIFLPVTEREMGGESARWSDVISMAIRAEELGFDSLWIEDHLLFRLDDAVSAVDAQGPWECWSILAALAAVTTRVEIGPLVTCTGYRNPALLAKIAATVDEISGGRLILGLGAGWHEPEYEAFGYPFDHRVSRFEEALTIVHGLLRTGHVDFRGVYHEAIDCELRPCGPRNAGPPIMIGSTGPRMLKLLATYGEIWNTWATPDIGALMTDMAKVDEACLAVERDPATLARSVCLLIDTPGAVGRPSELRPGITVSTPAELADLMNPFSDAGVSHVQLWIDPNNLAGIEWAAQALN